jgi:hypothetical protein
MREMIHLVNRTAVSSALAKLSELNNTYSEIEKRRNLANSRGLELQEERATYTDRILPIVEPARHDDIERLLAGAKLGLPTTKALESRQQQNSQADIHASYLGRDIALLDAERTRCDELLSELEAQRVEARALIMSAITDALVEECQAELKGITERFLEPLQVLSDYQHFKSRALRGEVRISWHTGTERVQVWPPYSSGRLADGRQIDPRECRATVIQSLLEEYARTAHTGA